MLAPLNLGNIPLSPEELQKELASVSPRGHVVAQAPELPFGFQSPRQFELLAHGLLQAEMQENGWYDLVQILPEGADKGADVLLHKEGSLVGVVQCKRYKSRLGRDLVLIELFKFLLFSFLDGRLPKEGCQYQFWTANHLTKEATCFFANPHDRLRALSSTELAGLFKKIQDGIKSLKSLALDAPVYEALRDCALRMNLRHVGPENLTVRLANATNVRRLFFRAPEDRQYGAEDPDVPHIEFQIATRRREQLVASIRAGRAGEAPFEASADLSEAFADFIASDTSAFVLVGGSGRGKSTWTARLQEAPPVAYVVDVIPGHEIAAGDDHFVTTLSRILSRRLDSLGTVEGEQRAVWRWVDAANRLIIIDGLDRAPEHARGNLAQWIQESVRVCANLAIRLVLISRPETWMPLVSTLEADVRQIVFQADRENAAQANNFASHWLAL